ncbi:MAG: hypothetical protein WCK89_04400 [bacterium]
MTSSRRTLLTRVVVCLHPATWDDLMRTIYVRQAIDKGLDDRADGRLKEVHEIRAQYNLPT